MKRPEGSYLLIDGVLRPQALPWLYGMEGLTHIEPLYVTTRWKDAADLGPILVEAGHGHPLIDEFVERAELQRSGCLLSSSEPASEVGRYLRQFITVTDDLGSNSLFRFADPLVARHWLDSYSSAARQSLLGPIACWWVASLPPGWSTESSMDWCCYQAGSGNAAAVPLNHLGTEQVAALERAQRWRFKERLHDWLSERFPGFHRHLSAEQYGAWLDARCSDAQAWGLASERSATLWAECCVQWGDDFSSRDDGPYRRWLTSSPDAASMTPDQRLQAFAASLPERV